jgi:hypothetical protein
MGAGSFGGASMMMAHTAVNMSRIKGGGYSEPPKEDEDNLNWLYKLTAVLIIIFFLGIGAKQLDHSRDKIEVPCTIIAKQEKGHQYKSNIVTSNEMAFRMDDGRTWETTVSLSTYAQYNVGDRLIMFRTNQDLHPEKYGTLYLIFDFMSFMVIGVCGLAGFLCLSGCLIFTDYGKLFGKKDNELQ